MAGEVAALESFAEVFRARIFDYCQLHCGHREDAEEAAQEIALKLCKEVGALTEAKNARA